MKIFLLNKGRFQLVFLGFLCLFISAGCGNEPAPEESREEAEVFTEPRIADLPPLTREYAAEIAERLIREQEDPAYIHALEVYAQDRMKEAEELFEPLVHAGNTTAMHFYAICLDVNHGLGGYNKSREVRIQAAMEGNPYTMRSLNRLTMTGGVYGRISGQWESRMIEYWRIRAEDGDLEAMFGLSRAENGGYFLARAAYLGHVPALLSFDTQDIFEEFRDFFEQHPEMPDWGEVVMGRLKALADAGNPVAQCNYGTIAEDQSYWEKSAEQGYRPAMVWLASSNTRHIEVEYEDVLKGVYHMLQMDLLDQTETDYVPRDLIFVYKDEKNQKKYLTREEYEALLARAKEWHKTHPYYYRYIHPLRRFE